MPPFQPPSSCPDPAQLCTTVPTRHPFSLGNLGCAKGFQGIAYWAALTVNLNTRAPLSSHICPWLQSNSWNEHYAEIRTCVWYSSPPQSVSYPNPRITRFSPEMPAFPSTETFPLNHTCLSFQLAFQGGLQISLIFGWSPSRNLVLRERKGM